MVICISDLYLIIKFKVVEGGLNKTRADKILEKVPPISGYLLILFPVIMSFIAPTIAAGYIIIVNVYFFYKSFSTCVQFAIALRRIKSHEQIDWREKIEGLEDIPNEILKLNSQLEVVKSIKYGDFLKEENQIYSQLRKYNVYLAKNSKLPSFLQKLLFKRLKSKTIRFLKNHIKELESLKGKVKVKPSELQHVFVIPHVKEPYLVLKQSIECLKNQTFNTKQISIVLAAEAKDPNGVAVSEQLKKEYEQYFNHIWITNHVLQPYDIIGKSANMRWATMEVYEKIKELGWDMEKVTLTDSDADSKIDPQYYSYVSYKYLTLEDAKYKLFCGGLVFYSNIWRLPFYARVKNSFSTIYNVSKLARADKYIPVSTYTLSYWMVKEIDFWTPWITPEDYNTFFKCLFMFKEKVQTVPIFLKVMSDAAEGEGHIATIKNNYKQSRRWAWGISDTGWMLKNLLQNFYKWPLRVTYVTAHVVFDHISGPTIALLILLGGNLPVLLNPDFRDQVAGARLPEISELVIRSTMVFLIIIIILDFYLKPRPDHYPWWKRITRILEWFAQPVAGFFLAALPGIEAQTRLIFGKYLEYYVTQKKGVEKPIEVKTDTKA